MSKISIHKTKNAISIEMPFIIKDKRYLLLELGRRMFYKSWDIKKERYCNLVELNICDEKEKIIMDMIKELNLSKYFLNIQRFFKHNHFYFLSVDYRNMNPLPRVTCNYEAVLQDHCLQVTRILKPVISYLEKFQDKKFPEICIWPDELFLIKDKLVIFPYEHICFLGRGDSWAHNRHQLLLFPRQYLLEDCPDFSRGALYFLMNSIYSSYILWSKKNLNAEHMLESNPSLKGLNPIFQKALHPDYKNWYNTPAELVADLKKEIKNWT